LPEICFYVKDANYKLIMCNNVGVRLFNLKEKAEVIGKSEYDFFPPSMADPIHEDDVMVIEHLKPVINRMELIVDENRKVKWVLTTKLPLFKKDGTVGGLMGTTREVAHPDMIPSSFRQHARALEYIKNHYNEPISVNKLAEMCNLSVSHFRTTFTGKFKMSPQKFILQIRIQMACKKLVHQDADISEIAQECGFCDQSYFTRQFRTHVGMTPLKYRSTAKNVK